MSKFLTAEKVIELSNQKGLKLGKGNPYNRLRYYTKIGWLPHMERKKDKNGKVVGHYPIWILSRIEYIQKLKKNGLTNEAITEKLKAKNAKRSFDNILDFWNLKENRIQTITLISLGILLLILFTETGFINLNKINKQQLLQERLIQAENFYNVIASDKSFIPKGEKAVFIKTNKATEQSKIHITFEDNYAPATQYWINKKIPFKGFYIELDTPVAQNAKFNWWLTL